MWNFNETLTNDVLRFEQPDPGFWFNILTTLPPPKSNPLQTSDKKIEGIS